MGRPGIATELTVPVGNKEAIVTELYCWHKTCRGDLSRRHTSRAIAPWSLCAFVLDFDGELNISGSSGTGDNSPHLLDEVHILKKKKIIQEEVIWETNRNSQEGSQFYTSQILVTIVLSDDRFHVNPIIEVDLYNHST